ncbi:hypothetical protein ACXWTF_12510 [Thiomicrolovo sp. ZZH C-3]
METDKKQRLSRAEKKALKAAEKAANKARLREEREQGMRDLRTLLSDPIGVLRSNNQTGLIILGLYTVGAFTLLMTPMHGTGPFLFTLGYFAFGFFGLPRILKRFKSEDE